MSYSAVVCRVANIRKHGNADRLKLGTVLGNQVVLGLDTKDGELGIYFNTDGQLSHEYCVGNDLYTASARAKLGLPAGPTGYLSDKRRVRSQRFRGEKSDGLWMPLTSLSWTGADHQSLKEGDTFTEFGGYSICQKYYTPATLRAMGGQQGKSKKDNRCFPKHTDTTQFRFVADSIPDEAVIYITEKLHGTSGRYGYVYEDVEPKWWHKLLNRFITIKGEYTYLNGSRNVVLEKTAGEGYYGTNEFRYKAVEGVTLHKGEILYFEIVGWINEGKPCKEWQEDPNNKESADYIYHDTYHADCNFCQHPKPIMPPHTVEKGQLKDIAAKYGNTIEYTYGCPKGESRMYVYKIVNVNEDGVAQEMSYPRMVARCMELGLPTVPLLYGPATLAQLAYMHSCDGKEALRKTVELLTEGESTLSPAQIREGVVIRIESLTGIGHIKNKQFAFGVLEGFWKEQEENVDLEEVS